MISSSCECFNSPWKPLRNIDIFQGQKLFRIGCESCDSMESEGRSGQFLELQSLDAKNFLRFDSHFLSCRLRVGTMTCLLLEASNQLPVEW